MALPEDRDFEMDDEHEGVEASDEEDEEEEVCAAARAAAAAAPPAAGALPRLSAGAPVPGQPWQAWH